MGGRRIKKNVETDYNKIKDMTTSNKIAIMQVLSKRANTRMTELEKKGHTNDKWAYGKVKNFLESLGRKRFYEGKKFNDYKLLNRVLQELTYFINAESSTIRGIERISQKRYDTFAKQHGLIQQIQTKTGKTKEQVIKEHKDSFYDFLSSSTFKDLRQRYSSEQIMDDFSLALMQGYQLDEIYKQYLEEQTNPETTFEKVQEKYNRAEWQGLR